MNVADVPTHDLAQRVSDGLKQYSFNVVLTVIRSLGRVVETQLGQGKGIRLDKFGTFSYGQNRVPVFYISSDFATQYNLKQRSVPAEKDTSAIVAKLNYLQLAKYASVDREAAEKIYKRLVEVIGRVLTEKKSLLLNLKAAEIYIFGSELTCTFGTQYSDAVSANKVNPQQLALHAHATLKADLAKLNLDVLAPEEGAVDPSYRKRSASANPLARTRERNPITGERDTEVFREPPRRERDRNPIFESADDTRISSSRSAAAAGGALARPTTSASSRNTLSGAGMTPRANSESTLLRKENLASLGQRPQTLSRSTPPAATQSAPAIIQKVREKLVQRGGSSGIKAVAKLLSIMDDNGDKRLSKEELKFGLRDYGIDMTATELDQVFAAFDRHHRGFINLDEFLVGIKGDLNERRQKCVRMAFDALDKDKSGAVTVDELMDVYDFSHNPDVVAGQKTKKEAMREFMRQWEGGESDGVVTLEEFMDYYKGISASIDGDDYFELMVRNAWRIAGGEGAAANTANKRILVTNKDGSQSVVTVHDELGVRPGDKEGYRRRLIAQGVEGDIELFGGVDATDKAKKQGAGAHNPSNKFSGRPPQTSQVRVPQFEKNVAAAKLAAAYRGRVARKLVAAEKRKLTVAEQERLDAEAEARIPRRQQLLRPQGRSYIGF